MGMAYLLGNWATNHWAIAIAGRLGNRRLISNMLDISLATIRPATAVARRSATQGQSNLVGMALYTDMGIWHANNENYFGHRYK